ncbi:MAG: hypothetical protein KTR25_19375, partial [Myxococcales bacterium]|nr:hypothetical protein [Myxococcales bacterium]
EAYAIHYCPLSPGPNPHTHGIPRHLRSRSLKTALSSMGVGFHPIGFCRGWGVSFTEVENYDEAPRLTQDADSKRS